MSTPPSLFACVFAKVCTVDRKDEEPLVACSVHASRMPQVDLGKCVLRAMRFTLMYFFFQILCGRGLLGPSRYESLGCKALLAHDMEPKDGRRSVESVKCMRS
eukprot:1154731-Pelagomonas_calceolata.AAC.7